MSGCARARASDFWARSLRWCKREMCARTPRGASQSWVTSQEDCFPSHLGQLGMHEAASQASKNNHDRARVCGRTAGAAGGGKTRMRRGQASRHAPCPRGLTSLYRAPSCREISLSRLGIGGDSPAKGPAAANGRSGGGMDDGWRLASFRVVLIVCVSRSNPFA